jgi:hypothetical protein
MSESNQDTTLKYWMDWLDAHHVDYTNIPNKDLIDWVNDMEETIGEFIIDMLPDEWLEDAMTDEEWEEIPDDDTEDHED